MTMSEVNKLFCICIFHDRKGIFLRYTFMLINLHLPTVSLASEVIKDANRNGIIIYKYAMFHKVFSKNLAREKTHV